MVGAGFETVNDATAWLSAASGSATLEPALTALERAVPLGTVQATSVLSVKDAVAPMPSAAVWHTTAPPCPGAGASQVHPAAAVTPAKVVPAGRASLRIAPAALSGPALETAIPNVARAPAATAPVGPVFVTDTFALGGGKVKNATGTS